MPSVLFPPRLSLKVPPVARFSVTVWVMVQATNASGQAAFDGLCPGTYGVSINREGYNGREFEVNLGCNEHYERTIGLLVKPGPDTCYTAKLVVRTKDSTTGTWLNGVTVTIMRNGIQIAQGTTGPEGTYVKEGLMAPATYSVTFSMTGYQTKTYDFHFSSCTTITETIWMAP